MMKHELQFGMSKVRVRSSDSGNCYLVLDENPWSKMIIMSQDQLYDLIQALEAIYRHLRETSPQGENA